MQFARDIVKKEDTTFFMGKNKFYLKRLLQEHKAALKIRTKKNYIQNGNNSINDTTKKTVMKPQARAHSYK